MIAYTHDTWIKNVTHVPRYTSTCTCKKHKLLFNNDMKKKCSYMYNYCFENAAYLIYLTTSHIHTKGANCLRSNSVTDHDINKPQEATR